MNVLKTFAEKMPTAKISLEVIDAHVLKEQLPIPTQQ
jgi:hypothetical protein